MTDPQTFSLPSMIDYDADEYSYHKQIYEIIQAKKKLDQQVMFGEIFKLFTSQPDLVSFFLKIHFSKNDSAKYQSNIVIEDVVSNTPLQLEPDKDLITTVNYLSDHNLLQICEWAMVVAQKNNMIYSIKEFNNDDKSFGFHLDNYTVEEYAKEAYGENYPMFFKQYLDKTLQQSSTTKKPHVKI